jgi:hypothetical protein
MVTLCLWVAVLALSVALFATGRGDGGGGTR